METTAKIVPTGCTQFFSDIIKVVDIIDKTTNVIIKMLAKISLPLFFRKFNRFAKAHKNTKTIIKGKTKPPKNIAIPNGSVSPDIEKPMNS